jgi:hypothetical protein
MKHIPFAIFITPQISTGMSATSSCYSLQDVPEVSTYHHQGSTMLDCPSTHMHENDHFDRPVQ